MPEFSIRAFDGGEMSRSALEGNPLLLIFWNTWCANCQRELPEIDRLGKQFGPRGLRLLAVNTGYNDSEDKARAYWKKHGHAFPTTFDRYFEVGQAFGVRGVPTIFLVDTRGIVRYKHSSLPQDMEEFLKWLAP